MLARQRRRKAEAETPSWLAAHLAARHARIVVAVGGDGTVADVASGIFGSAAALGIVPAGSTNITARSLGIPGSPYHAVSLLAGPHRLRQIDVGRSDGRSFLHVAGAGLDAEMFRRTNPIWKRRARWLAYLPPAIASLSLTASTVRLTTDHDQIEAKSQLVLVANGGSVIAPRFRLYPGIEPDDGVLDLLVFSPPDPIAVFSVLSQAGRMRLERSPHVRRWKVTQVRIEADPPLSVQLDGDVHGTTPREFALSPRSLSVVVPVESSR